MSKKELVKTIIDDLIDQGKDFHEITQGTLAHVKELESVSKTTIKRAKNEYKKEKIVVKSNYKETLIKRKIYKYLDRSPNTTLSDLREALPEIPPAKVSEYHLYWTRKRENAKVTKSQRRVMVSPRKLKEMVFSYLNANEDASCDDVYQAFPEANKSSITSYFGHWKKKRVHREKGKEGSLYHVIFTFLDNNPAASITDLRQSFADVPQRSLEVYLNLWQKKQSEIQNSPEKASTKPAKKRTKKSAPKEKVLAETAGRPKGKRKTSEVLKAHKTKGKETTTESAGKKTVGISRDEKTRIRELRKIIESQKLTLAALEVENSLLKDNFQSDLIEGFESMTKFELEDMKEFIQTYIKGLEAK